MLLLLCVIRGADILVGQTAIVRQTFWSVKSQWQTGMSAATSRPTEFYDKLS